MDLQEDIEKLSNELTASIKVLRKNGNELAKAERDYKIALRQEALKLREEKNMPVTLIAQIIYGVPEVAEMRFKRDVAETMYNTNQEHINVTKLKLSLFKSHLLCFNKILLSNLPNLLYCIFINSGCQYFLLLCTFL